jgi:SAM-dependent methyltransferase
MSRQNYEEYVRAEFHKFLENPSRAHAYLNAVEGMEVQQVLDVGCGAGQELLPFATCLQAQAVGVDVIPEAGSIGEQLYKEIAPEADIRFVQAPAEDLPFEDASFDVVICRIALPYTDNAKTLKEIARVLRPGGMFLLKIHHARFYLRQLSRSVAHGNLHSCLHAARVLTAGTLYAITGRQPHNRLTGNEVYQTIWMLRRSLAQVHLRIRSELRDSDSNPATPCFVIVKYGTESRFDQMV